MKRVFFGFFFFLSVSAVLAPVCHAVEMGIITGREQGTYYRFGQDIQDLMARNGIKLSVRPSTGSVENIYAVYKRPGTQLGIVQSDVLAFVAKAQSDDTLKAIARKTKMVFPLYNEEVHLLARKGIADFNDLADRRVAVGEEGSGTYLTARLFFEVSKVRPGEIVNIGTTVALAKLRAGEIDAMFYVSGAPVKFFSDDVREEDGLELIPIANRDISEFYPKAEIPAKTYAWQEKSVDTVSVRAVLISYDFRSGNCDKVGRFARIIADNLDKLVRNGHPKWKTVDLDAKVAGWEQYECVRKHLDAPAPKRPSRLNPVLDAMKKMLE